MDRISYAILLFSSLWLSAAAARANGGAGPSALEACRRAQDAIRERLAPESGMKFQPCAEAAVERKGNEWRVRTHVETKDATRLEFEAVLEYRARAVPIWQVLRMDAN